MANKYTMQAFIENLIVIAKNKIADLANKQLTDRQKKNKLDNTVINYVLEILEYANMNFVLKFAIEKWILPQIPVYTQAIYDLIKTRIDGITKA